MTEFKGRHLGFLAILCGAWIGARVATNYTPAQPIVGMPKTVAAAANRVGSAPPASDYLPARERRLPACCNLPHPKLLIRPYRHQVPLPTPPAAIFPPMPYPSAAPATALRTEPHQQPAFTQTTKRRKLAADIYAYSFLRFQAPGEGLAAGGQYGGSQSGLIATVAFARDAPALLLRTAVAHDNLRDREFAIGARWQPKPEWPVSLSVERRFRNIGPDSFAFYLAGGRSDINLPARFKLETYAQAGLVSGASNGYFFDAQARADRRILPQTPLPLHVGAGVWSGGQRGIMRLDVGPSLRTEIPVGEANIRLTADWRFRMAGDALPGNGPALTVSTGF